MPGSADPNLPPSAGVPIGSQENLEQQFEPGQQLQCSECNAIFDASAYQTHR
jgi:hypothetical protein